MSNKVIGAVGLLLLTVTSVCFAAAPQLSGVFIPNPPKDARIWISNKPHPPQKKMHVPAVSEDPSKKSIRQIPSIIETTNTPMEIEVSRGSGSLTLAPFTRIEFMETWDSCTDSENIANLKKGSLFLKGNPKNFMSLANGRIGENIEFKTSFYKIKFINSIAFNRSGKGIEFMHSNLSSIKSKTIEFNPKLYTVTKQIKSTNSKAPDFDEILAPSVLSDELRSNGFLGEIKVSYLSHEHGLISAGTLVIIILMIYGKSILTGGRKIHP